MRSVSSSLRRRSWRQATTSDGHAVQVLANVQDGAGARAAVGAHAEGVGLFRTELSFLGHAQEPTVEEQATGYAEVLEAFVGRKVVLRTLDAGSDKPLAFATLPDEANPALGVRGLRIARRDPDMLDRQLPNGWMFSLPDEEYLTPSGRTYDVAGIPPDIAVPTLTPEQFADGTDPAFRVALQAIP